MKAFVDCDKCGKESSFQPDGLVKCPECGTSSLRRVVVGPSAPDWFRDEAREKKDRRSARTRKRDAHNATGLPAWPYASGENVCIRMVRGDRVSGPNFWLVAPHDFSVSDWVPCVMPSLPRSHSSSAPMVPEVSQ